MVNLEELVAKIEKISLADIRGIQISGINYDSRKVNKGDLFVAIKGFQSDGHEYIKNALDNGASAVLLEDEDYCSKEFPWILVPSSRVALADISAEFYDHPSRQLTLIGVTGTNGKTTTTNLIASILEGQGQKVGLIGTIHNRIGNTVIPVERTTPESLDLQKLFREMVENGVTHVVMEVSSHALDLERVKGCDYDIAVFTNLTQDHLDYHKTMEEYYRAKSKLFLEFPNSKGGKMQKKFAIINNDDAWGQLLKKDFQGNTITYAIENLADFKAEGINITARGASYQVKDKNINLELTGKFNVYNSLAALATAQALEISLEEAVKSLEKVKGIAGRFQLVDGAQDFAIIIDYAHTPDSLINILTTVQEFVQGRIITVFGCGGDRDRTKRPLMGKAAAQNSDFCFVTSDNPRSEEPNVIIKDIIPGVAEVVEQDKYKVVVDRKQAIKEAIELAQKGDVIVIAGKGHETYQEVNGKKYPFDDKEIAEEILKTVK